MISTDSSVFVQGRGNLYPEDLRVGDLVMTHREHWRKIAEVTEKESNSLWVVHYKGCNLNTYLSEDHEVLTLYGWAKIKNLIKGTKIAVFNGAIIYEPIGLIHEAGIVGGHNKTFEIRVEEDDSYLVNNMVGREDGSGSKGYNQ